MYRLSVARLSAFFEERGQKGQMPSMRACVSMNGDELRNILLSETRRISRTASVWGRSSALRLLPQRDERGSGVVPKES